MQVICLVKISSVSKALGMRCELSETTAVLNAYVRQDAFKLEQELTSHP